MATKSFCDRCGKETLTPHRIRIQKNGDINGGQTLREFCAECHEGLYEKLLNLLTAKAPPKKGKKTK